MKHALEKQLDPERLARVAALLLKGQKMNVPYELFSEVAEYLCLAQRPDGGWVDVEETIWCLSFLRKMLTEYRDNVRRGEHWLNGQRLSGGGWGRNDRDLARIPYTSWVGILLPDIIATADLDWLKNETVNELTGDPVLVYKLALPLWSFSRTNYELSGVPVAGLVSCLASAQNIDGGFGPWHGHPCGSDPWCTAVVTLALLCYPDYVDKNILHKILDWLLANQLNNGLWPYHYIDEGSALAYWALKELLQWKAKEGN